MSPKQLPLLAFGPGAEGAGPGARNSGACPTYMCPTVDQAADAVATLRSLIPHPVSFRVPVGYKGDMFDSEVEAVGKAAWRFLEMSQVPSLWPYADNIRFNPGDRARYLRALAIVDLYMFRPKERR